MSSHVNCAQEALSSIRVIDLGRYVAGPYCATLLADLGADVVRVERIDGGDDRLLGPVSDDGSGSTYLAVNRNKRNLTLNFSTPDGLEVLHQLVATADVVVANMPLPVLEKLGLDYESLCKLKPDVILTTCDTFGPGGPYSNNVGFDGIAQAMSGAAYMSGSNGHPAKSASPWVDYLTATHAAFATMTALRWKDMTGQGQHVHASLLASAITATGGLLVEQSAHQSDWEPIGNRTHVAALADVCNTRDGAIIVQLAGDSLFRRWVQLMGDVEWLDDPRFATEASRLEHAEMLAERLTSWCTEKTTDEALEQLRKAGIPCAPVYSPRQVLDDMHVTATDMLPELRYPGVPPTTRVPHPAVRLTQTPLRMRRTPATLGEHTVEVLAELGYQSNTIQELRNRGIC